MTADTQQAPPQPCVMCASGNQFMDGLCVACLTAPILQARVRYTERCEKLRQHALDGYCLFCDRPVAIISVRIFNTACHWMCVVTWAAASRREQSDHAARVSP